MTLGTFPKDSLPPATVAFVKRKDLSLLLTRRTSIDDKGRPINLNFCRVSTADTKTARHLSTAHNRERKPDRLLRYEEILKSATAHHDRANLNNTSNTNSKVTAERDGSVQVTTESHKHRKTHKVFFPRITALPREKLNQSVENLKLPSMKRHQPYKTKETARQDSSKKKNDNAATRLNGKRLFLLSRASSRAGKSPHGRAGKIHGTDPRLPLTPQEAKEQFGLRMSSFELKEVEGYDKIWFLGLDAKKVEGVASASDNNHGYDDKNGNFIKVLHDHLAYRYEILEVIGKGCFGQVVKVLDHKTNQTVAIKIVRNIKRFKEQSKVEVLILQELRRSNSSSSGRSNIIQMLRHFTFRSHLCIVFELFGINLYESMKLNEFRGLKIFTVRKIAFNILKCLCLTYKHDIIHCDLKPENILIDNLKDANIKVIDFGSSCRSSERVYTYIQSRFYRAPEVILGAGYGKPIDMWSLACIIVELINGSPLFPGENEWEQLACIMEVIGDPPFHFKEQFRRWNVFFDSDNNLKNPTNSKGVKRLPSSKKLSHVLMKTNADILDLLNRCLQWEPEKRITPAAAIAHKFFRVAGPVLLRKVAKVETFRSRPKQSGREKEML